MDHIRTSSPPACSRDLLNGNLQFSVLLEGLLFLVSGDGTVSIINTILLYRPLGAPRSHGNSYDLQHFGLL